MSRMVSPDGSDQADSGRGVNLTAELQQIVSPTESVGIADRLVRCYPLLNSLLATETARVRDRRDRRHSCIALLATRTQLLPDFVKSTSADALRNDFKCPANS